jgi:hypothetical protein
MDLHPERTRQLRKYSFYTWKEKVTKTVMEHYSNGAPRCACCGESERDFLAIDHIEGHGNEHRRKIFGRVQGGWQLYVWLIRQGFPSGFQVLCFNCNLSKAKHGKCIHVAKPVPPPPPPDLRTMSRTPQMRPRGDAASLVRWKPRTRAEGHPFKESSNAGKSSAETR